MPTQSPAGACSASGCGTSRLITIVGPAKKYPWKYTNPCLAPAEIRAAFHFFRQHLARREPKRRIMQLVPQADGANVDFDDVGNSTSGMPDRRARSSSKAIR